METAEILKEMSDCFKEIVMTQGTPEDKDGSDDRELSPLGYYKLIVLLKRACDPSTAEDMNIVGAKDYETNEILAAKSHDEVDEIVGQI